MTGCRIGDALKRLLKSGAFWTALIAVASVSVAVWQVREAKEQFLSSNARGDYTDILTGLDLTWAKIISAVEVGPVFWGL
jgi:hypothetical protein